MLCGFPTLLPCAAKMAAFPVRRLGGTPCELRFYISLLYDFTRLYFTILLESSFIPTPRSFTLGMDSSPCRLARLENDDPEYDAIALSCPIFLWTIGYFISGGRVVDYMPHQERKE